MAWDNCWIRTIEYDAADDGTKAAYDAARGPDGELDDLYKPYGLRPHMLGPADGLYRATLHDEGNSLPNWLLELISTYVAMLADCEYAFVHHGENFKVLLGDRERAENMLAALRDERPGDALDQREAAIMAYVAKLTRSPEAMAEPNLAGLRAAGLDDGEILEVNQVAASFNYWVRVINGLGIRLLGVPISYYR